MVLLNYRQWQLRATHWSNRRRYCHLQVDGIGAMAVVVVHWQWVL